MPPYLKVCGQGEQKSKFWAKNIMLWPKMAIFRGSKIFKKNSSDRPHRVLSNEVSYDPIHQRHQVLHILVLVLLILHRQYHDTTTTIITTTPESFVFKISSWHTNQPSSENLKKCSAQHIKSSMNHFTFKIVFPNYFIVKIRVWS